jgi:hypothetical protein
VGLAGAAAKYDSSPFQRVRHASLKAIVRQLLSIDSQYASLQWRRDTSCEDAQHEIVPCPFHARSSRRRLSVKRPEECC